MTRFRRIRRGCGGCAARMGEIANWRQVIWSRRRSPWGLAAVTSAWFSGRCRFDLRVGCLSSYWWEVGQRIACPAKWRVWRRWKRGRRPIGGGGAGWWLMDMLPWSSSQARGHPAPGDVGLAFDDGLDLLDWDGDWPALAVVGWVSRDEAHFVERAWEAIEL